MAHAGGRPPKYKNVEEIEEKIEQYFAICEGEPLLDDEGNQVINKYGYPCWINFNPHSLVGSDPGSEYHACSV